MGIKINVENKKYMKTSRIEHNKRGQYKTRRKDIETVRTFKYLGSAG